MAIICSSGHILTTRDFVTAALAIAQRHTDSSRVVEPFKGVLERKASGIFQNTRSQLSDAVERECSIA